MRKSELCKGSSTKWESTDWKIEKGKGHRTGKRIFPAEAGRPKYRDCSFADIRVGAPVYNIDYRIKMTHPRPLRSQIKYVDGTLLSP